MTAPYLHPLRTADLAQRKPTRFSLAPEGAALEALAAAVGASALRAVSFQGELRPSGRHDWVLEGELAAEAEQPCVVTLAPVTTPIRETVRRRYLSEMPDLPEGGETEMPEDDTVEPLAGVIDPGRVMEEALALALPLYPRAPEAELGEAVFSEPGVAPLREAEVKPFAGLATRRDRLKDEGRAPQITLASRRNPAMFPASHASRRPACRRFRRLAVTGPKLRGFPRPQGPVPTNSRL